MQLTAKDWRALWVEEDYVWIMKAPYRHVRRALGRRVRVCRLGLSPRFRQDAITGGAGGRFEERAEALKLGRLLLG
jgi:hypothetical protein